MSRHTLAIAVAVETRKAFAARVLTATSSLLVVGVATLAASTVLAARGGDAELTAKLGPAAALGGWPGVLFVADQVVAAAGMLAFGVGLSWIYAREFADGTITGLFGLPVSRPVIALAKLIVYLLWTLATAIALTAAIAVVAAVVGAGPPDLAGLARLLGLAAMTALLPIPAAWAATLGRGLLPAIATTVALMAITQIVVVAGGTWFPFAAPALWAVDPGTVPPMSLAAAAVVPVAFGLLTLHAWRRLQLDR